MAALPTVKPITARDIGGLENDKGIEVANGTWREREMAGRIASHPDGSVNPMSCQI